MARYISSIQEVYINSYLTRRINASSFHEKVIRFSFCIITTSQLLIALSLTHNYPFTHLPTPKNHPFTPSHTPSFSLSCLLLQLLCCYRSHLRAHRYSSVWYPFALMEAGSDHWVHLTLLLHTAVFPAVRNLFSQIPSIRVKFCSLILTQDLCAISACIRLQLLSVGCCTSKESTITLKRCAMCSKRRI